MIALNDQNKKVATLNLDACDLTIRHQGRTISVTAAQTLRNGGTQPISKTVFSLNPGMKLSEMTIGGSKVTAERKDHLIIAGLPAAVEPGQTVIIQFVYEGQVDERICNLDIKEDCI